MDNTTECAIEVAYATADRSQVIALTVPAGCTADEAIARSGLVQQFPELASNTLPIGVFSQRVARDYAVKPGDRIEIYRPLLCDPKEWRLGKVKRTHYSKLTKHLDH